MRTTQQNGRKQGGKHRTLRKLPAVLIHDAGAITDLRLALLSNGYVPIATHCKEPRRNGWNSEVVDSDLIRSWLGRDVGKTRWPATGLRIEAGLAAIDADIPDERLAKAWRFEAERIVPGLATALERGRDDDSPKTLFLMRREGEPFDLRSGMWVVDPNDPKPEHFQVEVFAGELHPDGRVGRQIGAFGPHTVTPEGVVVRSYAWRTERTPADTPLAALPVITEAQAHELAERFDQLAEAFGLKRQAKGGKIVVETRYDLDDEMVFENDEFRGDLKALEAYFRNCEAVGQDCRISGSFTGEGGGIRQDRCHVGWSVWDTGAHLFVHDYRTAITHRPVTAKPAEPVRIANVLADARARLKLPPIDDTAPEAGGESDEHKVDRLIGEARRVKFSAASVANVVGAIVEGGLRYAKDEGGDGSWALYGGPQWALEDASQGKRLITELVVGISELVPPGRTQAAQRKAMQSYDYISSVRRFVSEAPAIVTPRTAWDGEGWLLPTLTEVIDLRTGQRRPGRPADLIRRRTGVDMADAYQPASCPEFSAFLATITGGDTDYQRFLQQWMGQGLVGELLEQRLVYFHGDGGNGKGTLLTVQRLVLGDFVKAAPKDLFVEGHFEGHPTSLRCFDGARAVIGAEPRVKTTWAFNLIKMVTGGDTLEVRGMRENFYPVQAVCALTIAGNAEPRFELVDRAVTRRFLKAPFEHEIGKDEEDTRYPQHLVDREGPGILRWMVEGLLDWMQTRRLFTGAVVDEATREYLEAEDVLATFIRERCEEDAESRLDVKQLYQEWRLAALADGRPPSSQNAITRRLKKLFPKVEMLRSNGQTIALGLRFRAVVIRPAPHIRVVR